MSNNTKNFMRAGGAEWVVGGLLTVNGHQIASTSSPAATGSTIADAAAIATGIAFVSGADGTKGVLLPVILPGETYVVKNTANAVLKVWPNAAGVAINGLAAGAAISMAAYTCCDFVGASTVQVYTDPYVPS